MLSKFAYENNNIRFEKRNGRVWVSLTDMAKANNKKVHDWSRLNATLEFLEELQSLMGFPVTDTVQGGQPDKQGTWGIEEVAEEFKRWCLLPKKDKCRLGVLYVYQDANNDAYKIGFTTDIKKRQKQHHTSNPFLELVKVYEGVTVDFESLIHLNLSKYRIHKTTEWYIRDSKILSIINLHYSEHIQFNS